MERHGSGRGRPADLAGVCLFAAYRNRLGRGHLAVLWICGVIREALVVAVHRPEGHRGGAPTVRGVDDQRTSGGHGDGGPDGVLSAGVCLRIFLGKLRPFTRPAEGPNNCQ